MVAKRIDFVFNFRLGLRKLLMKRFLHCRYVGGLEGDLEFFDLVQFFFPERAASTTSDEKVSPPPDPAPAAFG